MSKALIVIDMQNDFAHANGSLTTKEAQAAVPEVRKLINQFTANGDAVFYTQDTHLEDYLSTQEGLKLPVRHCIYGSWGWRIIDELDYKIENENIHHLNKCTFGYDDWYDEHLEKYDEVWICGVVSSICVVSNALIIKSLWPELPIKFIAYASAGLTPENHLAAIEVMKSCQIEVIT